MKILVTVFLLLSLNLLLSCSSSNSAITQANLSVTPNIVIFEASKNSITIGEQLALSWQVDGATSVSIEPGPGVVTLSGSCPITPSLSTSVTLTATSKDGLRTSRTLTIQVLPALRNLVFQTMFIEDYGRFNAPSATLAPGSLSSKVEVIEAALLGAPHVGWNSSPRFQNRTVESVLYGDRMPDFAYFGGHSSIFGPLAFPTGDGGITNGIPGKMHFSTAPSPMRWFLNDGCDSLFDNAFPGSQPHWSGDAYGLDRWFHAMNFGSGRMHAYFGFRGQNASYSGERAPRSTAPVAVRISAKGAALGEAWVWAGASEWLGLKPSMLHPAVLSSFDGMRDFFYESIQLPWTDPVVTNHSDHSGLSFHAISYINPDGQSEQTGTATSTHGTLVLPKNLDGFVVDDDSSGIKLAIRPEKLPFKQVEDTKAEMAALEYASNLNLSDSYSIEKYFDHRAVMGDSPWLTIERIFVVRRKNKYGQFLAGDGNTLMIGIDADGKVSGIRFDWRK